MNETRKYMFTNEMLDSDADELTCRIATVERLGAIAEELAEIGKGLRFMAMAAGLEKLAKTPEILQELLRAAGVQAPPSDSPPSKT
jgi:hypothetical protein